MELLGLAQQSGRAELRRRPSDSRVRPERIGHLALFLEHLCLTEPRASHTRPGTDPWWAVDAGTRQLGGECASVRKSSAARNRWEASIAYGQDEDGGLEFDTGVSLSVRPQPRWELSVDPSYERELDTQQYINELGRTGIETFGRRYVFAHIDRSTIVMQTQLNYTFKPDLTLDVYAEPFASSGDIFDHGELAVPRTRLVRRYGTDGTTAEPLADGTLRVTGGPDSFDLAQPRRQRAVVPQQCRPTLRVAAREHTLRRLAASSIRADAHRCSGQQS